MKLKELIERAEKKAGSQIALSTKINQNPGNIRAAKAGSKGLPDYACVMIAEMIEENPITVIAASNLNTEKNEERRKVWKPFVSHAAALFFFGVILNMSPTPSEAAPMLQVTDLTLYIM